MDSMDGWEDSTMRRNPYEDSVDHPARPAPPRTASTNGLHFAALRRATRHHGEGCNASRQPDELRGELSDVKYELVVAGKSDEENLYRKGRALQTHLTGYENPSTLMLLGKREVQFVVIASKAKVPQPPLEASDGSDDKKVEDEAKHKKLFEQVVQTIGEGNKVGVLPKDKMLGKFVTEWQNQNERNAAKMRNKLMSHFSDVMSGYIDEGKKVTHEQLGEQIEAKLEDSKFWKNVKLGDDFETGFGDWCYSPIIQSGGKCDLKSSAVTDDQRLKAGVILCSLGMRYKSYCSNVGRTFMIDPTKDQEENYLFLIDLQKYAIGELRDNVTCKDIYQKVADKINADRPDLLQYFAKTAGFGMGIEFRDPAYPLSAKGTRQLKSDMVVALTLGFNNIPDGKNSQYALSLIDTIQITKDGGKILSEGMKGKDDVMFYMEEEDKKLSRSAQKDAHTRRDAAPTAVVKSKLRNENREIDADAINRHKQHQRELAARRQEEGLDKYSGEGGTGGSNREKQWRRFESYVKDSQLPDAVASRKIVVDARRLTVILPINGFAVPFHVNTLKSLVEQEEGDYTVLRFLFTTPGANSGKKEDTPFEDPNATFIRGLTYRSTDPFRFIELHKEINDLKRAAVKRGNERKEMADNCKRPIRLTEVQLRPSFDGKRQAGDVEIHSDGIRYQSPVKSEQRLDVLSRNIKHQFLQPCHNELIVILHIHIKSPITIGKKKTKGLEFFRPVPDACNKKRKGDYHNEDEQDGYKRRADLDKHFKALSDDIAEASSGRGEGEILFRETGFRARSRSPISSTSSTARRTFVITDLAKDTAQLVKAIQKDKGVTMIYAIDVLRGSKTQKIAGAGHDKLAHAGKGSSIDRGDCERLFQLLGAEQVLGERYERNGLGFTNAYLTLGPRAQQLLSGKLTVQMGFTKGGESGGGGGKKGKAPAKQKTIDESYDHE
ncbi:FACT complex subunit-domain-containing protein [Rhodotorula toruloides]